MSVPKDKTTVDMSHQNCITVKCQHLFDSLLIIQPPSIKNKQTKKLFSVLTKLQEICCVWSHQYFLETKSWGVYTTKHIHQVFFGWAIMTIMMVVIKLLCYPRLSAPHSPCIPIERVICCVIWLFFRTKWTDCTSVKSKVKIKDKMSYEEHILKKTTTLLLQLRQERISGWKSDVYIHKLVILPLNALNAMIFKNSFLQHYLKAFMFLWQQSNMMHTVWAALL